jgi:hypothetical protein
MKADRLICRTNAALTKGIQPIGDASSFDVFRGVAFSTKPCGDRRRSCAPALG